MKGQDVLKEKILQMLEEADGFISGQEISEALGVSRTAVWKAVRRLTEDGCSIEAVRNRGYRLKGQTDLLSEETIRSFLTTEWAGRTLVIEDTLESTNQTLKRMAEEGAGHGTLLLAREQTAGKGRRGRTWSCPKGEGIALSLLLRPQIEPMHASMLTLVMALAIRRAIEQTAGLSCMIKWPNDLVADGRKLCGILTEMSADPDCVNYIVTGAGINVLNPDFPQEFRQRATSIREQTGRTVSRSELTARVMNCFEEVYPVFLKTQDLSGLMQEYNACLINRGREVRIEGAQQRRGIARGISRKGELLVEIDGSVETVLAGEVSVRGIYGYV